MTIDPSNPRDLLVGAPGQTLALAVYRITPTNHLRSAMPDGATAPVYPYQFFFFTTCADVNGNPNPADVTDIGHTGAGPDGQVTVDDIIAFVNAFGDGDGCPGAAPCNLADVTDIGHTGAGPDGELTVDDTIAFINAFGEGCGGPQ